MTLITPLTSIKSAFHDINAFILKTVSELSDEELAWRPHAACNSIAFIFWHIARWTDNLQMTIPGMTEELSRRLPPGQEIWQRDQLAARWGFDHFDLGVVGAGTDRAAEEINALRWPVSSELLDYAQKVFTAAENAISLIDEEQFQENERQQTVDEYMEASRGKTVTVGNAIMEHLIHNTAHMGELFYLLGLLKQANLQKGA